MYQERINSENNIGVGTIEIIPEEEKPKPKEIEYMGGVGEGGGGGLNGKELAAEKDIIDKLIKRVALINHSLDKLNNATPRNSPLLIDVKVSMRNIIRMCKDFKKSDEFESISIKDKQFVDDLEHIENTFTMVANDTMENHDKEQIVINNVGDIKRVMENLNDEDKNGTIVRLTNKYDYILNIGKAA